MPDDYHTLARVSGELDASACASAANLQQIGKRLPIESLAAGQRYCMSTSNDYIVEFTISAIAPNHDLSLVASAWLNPNQS